MKKPDPIGIPRTSPTFSDFKPLETDRSTPSTIPSPAPPQTPAATIPAGTVMPMTPKENDPVEKVKEKTLSPSVVRIATERAFQMLRAKIVTFRIQTVPTLRNRLDDPKRTPQPGDQHIRRHLAKELKQFSREEEALIAQYKDPEANLTDLGNKAFDLCQRIDAEIYKKYPTLPAPPRTRKPMLEDDPNW